MTVWTRISQRSRDTPFPLPLLHTLTSQVDEGGKNERERERIKKKEKTECIYINILIYIDVYVYSLSFEGDVGRAL